MQNPPGCHWHHARGTQVLLYGGLRWQSGWQNRYPRGGYWTYQCLLALVGPREFCVQPETDRIRPYPHPYPQTQNDQRVVCAMLSEWLLCIWNDISLRTGGASFAFFKLVFKCLYLLECALPFAFLSINYLAFSPPKVRTFLARSYQKKKPKKKNFFLGSFPH